MEIADKINAFANLKSAELAFAHLAEVAIWLMNKHPELIPEFKEKFLLPAHNKSCKASEDYMKFLV